MDNTFNKNLFMDYFFNNKGTLFKSFEININNFHSSYDIYWGDPNIIFDKRVLEGTFPLAVTIIPHRKNYPNPRIFLHEKLERKYNNVFEMVIAHEIGHLWLHDVIGFNHPQTSDFMEENESEVWADYFAYSFFIKYRNINSIEYFKKILEEVNNLQIKIYNINPEKNIEILNNKKIEDLILLYDKNNHGLKQENPIITHMINTIEITLTTLGDIFK